MAKLSIQTISSPTIWESFLASHPESNFLSSYNWGRFHQALGKPVFYLGVFQGSLLIGSALVIKETAKRGNYLTIAGGPILDFDHPSSFSFLIIHLKSLARHHQCNFVRIRPQLLNTPQHQQIFQSAGLHPSPIHLTADLTLQLDLSPPPDHLLAQMRKNTRYSIRQAQKLGITISTSQDPSQIKVFHQHQLRLASKHHFVPFSYDFLYHQFKIFAAVNQATLFHAFFKDQLLASAFIIFYGSEAVYHYGISTFANHKLPGSYACQWAAIKAAKARHMNRYNFWGIAPASSPSSHRFAGVSLFKRGFGGQEIAYLPAHDLPTSKLYSAIYLFESSRAKLRHL